MTLDDMSVDIQQQQQQQQQQQEEGFPHTRSTMIPNSLIAGYVAGVCGTIIGHPFDSLKVLLQTRWSHHTGHTPSSTASAASTAATTVSTANPISTSSSSSSYKMIPHAMTYRNLVSMIASSSSTHTLSLRSLYAGVSSPLLTVGLIQCINFSIYDTCRQFLHHHNNNNHSHHTNINPKAYLYHDSIFNVGLSSFISGGIVSFITSPLAIIKTKQQIMSWDFAQAWRDTTTRNPFHSSQFFLGFTPHFICESVGRSVYLMTYESLKRSCIHYQSIKNENHNYSLPLGQRMICAALSGIASWSFIFPLDVIRSRMYFDSISSNNNNNIKSTWSMMQQMYLENDKRYHIFFRGYGVTILRAGPVAAVVLPVYDKTLEWLLVSRP